MIRRCFPILISILLLGAAGARADRVRLPLDPATLGGADIFTDAETHVTRAAQTAQLEFTPDSRPLPPEVIIPLDTTNAAVKKRNELLFWRGDMLPDQLAPGETGTLIRKKRGRNGRWNILRTQADCAHDARTNLVPVVRVTKHVTLPRLIIETPYQLGLLGENPVTLILWRTAEEGSVPLGGAIVLPDPTDALLEALAKRLPPFPSQDDWATEFEALAR